jgi:ABC-type branched-subunit amino acid transport system substrate-binding protein
VQQSPFVAKTVTQVTHPFGATFQVPAELDDLMGGSLVASKEVYRVALLIPLCGAAGIWAPSCISSAQVAVAELNNGDGIRGRRVQLVMIDAALEASQPIEDVINELIESQLIDAIVGMHISAVRQRLSKVVRQRIPYIYTPLYEGGENTPGLFAIGETPDKQLGPAIQLIQERYEPKSWALIGNDYVWPRSSHLFAKRILRDLSARIALECYLPFGQLDMEPVISAIKHSEAEAVLLSLVGQDAVIFNRAFGQNGLHTKAVRLSCSIEENSLLACGAANLERLFVVSSYFGALKTDANLAFKEKYYGLHGEHAPVLNALGQSTYEGMHYLAGLVWDYSESWRQMNSRNNQAVSHRSGRKSNQEHRSDDTPMYLARADGLQFYIEKDLKT